MKNLIYKLPFLFLVLTLLLSCAADREATKTPPQLSTILATNITLNSASSGGNVTSDGGASVTSRGIVWSTSAAPNISLTTKTTDGSGTGTFTSEITNLTPSTNYFVRAYATNNVGTGYGNEITFTTGAIVLPTITTTTASSISGNSAISGGSITSDGGGIVTARGVVWSVMQNPTVALSTKTTDGSGIGAFTSNITGLSPNTRYYVRAYATNSTGTSYGNEISFITSDTIDVVYINDTVLGNIYYHQTSYLNPTKLVFSNLTNVNGYVYFHQTNNIVEVEFPLLTNIGGYVYFNQNLSLKKIKAPNLVSAKDYLYIYGNTILQELNICNLNSISCANQEPYYSISNNNASIDNNQPCFNVTLYGTSLTTTPITQFSRNTAIGGGTFTRHCSNNRGSICWSTRPNPTSNDFTAIGSSSNGNFTANLTGLLPNTTYYVRAFSGNVYGNQVSFTTLP